MTSLEYWHSHKSIRRYRGCMSSLQWKSHSHIEAGPRTLIQPVNHPWFSDSCVRWRTPPTKVIICLNIGWSPAGRLSIIWIQDEQIKTLQQTWRHHDTQGYIIYQICAQTWNLGLVTSYLLWCYRVTVWSQQWRWRMIILSDGLGAALLSQY